MSSRSRCRTSDWGDGYVHKLRLEAFELAGNGTTETRDGSGRVLGRLLGSAVALGVLLVVITIVLGA